MIASRWDEASQPDYILKLAMHYNIQDPEETEKLLLDAGFSVGVRETKFVVSLNTRTVSRSEVAVVLGCEGERGNKGIHPLPDAGVV